MFYAKIKWQENVVLIVLAKLYRNDILSIASKYNITEFTTDIAYQLSTAASG